MKCRSKAPFLFNRNVTIALNLNRVKLLPEGVRIDRDIESGNVTALQQEIQPAI